MANYSVRPWEGDSLLDHLLFHRGITDPTEREAFLSPDYEKGIHDPMMFADIKPAIKRIRKAIKDGERIAIFSDFDADGLPGATILHDFFKKISYLNFENYIPHRHLEGFGLNNEAIDKMHDRGTNLIITIDCGITDVEKVDYANSLGIDVIITDHHLPGVQLPKALAVIDPKREDCKYAEKMLCGSGVIFKVIQALLIDDRSRSEKDQMFSAAKIGWEKWLLDMVGLATLSDMVPLRGENRVFAHFGLRVLRKSPRLGIMKLLHSLGVKQETLVEDDIGFLITPRINAASRMADPVDAFKMLTAATDEEADIAVRHLNKLNDERKGTVAAMIKEIKKKVEERSLQDRPVLALGNPNWKPALLGLAATSLVRDYGRPVFLWGRDENGVLKGSCRSDGAADIVELMRSLDPKIFIDKGGHKMAGGFSLSNEYVHLFADALCESYAAVAAQQKANIEAGIIIETFVDAVLDPQDITWETYSHIEKLAPFGEANPKPLFMIKQAPLTGIKMFGKTGNHLEVNFSGARGKKVSAIQFFCEPTEKLNALKAGDAVSLVVTMEKSVFRNFPELRLRIVDIL
ncbi:MAG: single-stranded-DNA-specific exonuclease RecJ [Patescibacteria group bacterium]